LFAKLFGPVAKLLNNIVLGSVVNVQLKLYYCSLINAKISQYCKHWDKSTIHCILFFTISTKI